MKAEDRRLRIALIVALAALLAGAVYWLAPRSPGKGWKKSGAYLLERQRRVHPGRR